MSRSIRFQLLVVIAVLGLSSPALSAEYCVSCSGPDASYRCEVAGDGADARAWLMCITELAKEGGHDSCSVDRKAASPCPGIHKVLTAPEGTAPVPPMPVHTAIPQPAPPPPQTAPAAGPPVDGEPPKRVPQTMQELAGDTYEASKEGLKKAGDSVTNSAKKAGDAVTGTAQSAGNKIGEAGSAVGNAAKKTWTCLTSLFQSC